MSQDQLFTNLKEIIHDMRNPLGSLVLKIESLEEKSRIEQVDSKIIVATCKDLFDACFKIEAAISRLNTIVKQDPVKIE